jgi:hypothetical protein
MLDRPFHCWFRSLIFLAVLVSPRLVQAGEIVHYFPADEQEANMQTKWRVVWGIERQNGDRSSQVLYIKEAYFTRAKGEREIKVLGDSRLTEIFVPYNQGFSIWDITTHAFSLVTLNEKALGPGCIVPGKIYDENGHPADKGPVAVEVHDDNVRWMDYQNTIRRGQSMQVWSVLSAGNYRYIILYVFRDDGLVGFRLGGTAHNLYSSNDDQTTHLHSGCWRVNVDLGDQSSLILKKVTLDTSGLKTVVSPVVREARIEWNPKEFTRLRAESTKEKNGHDPSSAIGYELVPSAPGIGRYHGTNPPEDFTEADFWVLRDRGMNVQCADLPRREVGADLTGGKPVLWYQTGVLHRARIEDFGKKGFNNYEGVAITAWAGFDLMPRNFFSCTPLFPCR